MKEEEGREEKEEEDGHASSTIFGIKVIKSSCWERLGCITYPPDEKRRRNRNVYLRLLAGTCFFLAFLFFLFMFQS